MINDGSSNELHEKVPFKSPLVESGYKSQLDDIRALKSDPEKIVRVSRYHFPKDFAARHKKIFDKLKNEYGINVPNVNFVIGPGEKGDIPRLYIVTDRIHGTKLEDKKFDPDELSSARDKLDNLFSSIIQYYWDVSRQGGDYNDDLYTRQFIWGRRKGDTEDKIYLVDLGLRIIQHGLDEGSNGYLLQCIGEPYPLYRPGVWGDMVYLERKHNIRLSKARQKLGQFMGDILSKGPLWELDKTVASDMKALAESV